MKTNISDRIKNVMSAVFGISNEEINDESSPDTIESWDSLKHMNLVVALEEEFNVEFTDDNIIELINMKLIMAVLLEKLPSNRS
uniref:Acyl carrier protein, ACP n=1 Tax=uncultured marine thaumarchaeote KM3_87_H02 TaxID=1456331 RepID=A0A075HWE9_9ARCH|nr:acyl carrier protein, ACP [uncultured marine thaumarchaeote KM3_87_H02]